MEAALVKSRLLSFVDPLPGLAGRCVSGGRLNLDLSSADPDSIAPGVVSDLVVASPAAIRSTSPGAPPAMTASTGTAARYELRVATHAFAAADFDSGARVPAPLPLPSGTGQVWHLTGLDTRTLLAGVARARRVRQRGPGLERGRCGHARAAAAALSTGEVSASSTTGNVVTQSVEIANDSPGARGGARRHPPLDFAGTQSAWPEERGEKGQPGRAARTAGGGVGGT
jgi:hypothetical protein